MEEISNRTLATLLVVAIVISLAGTFFAMRGTSVVSQTITGYAESDTGNTQVNITSVVSIQLTQATVDFGAGVRNSSHVTFGQLCALTSGTTTVVPADCWGYSGTYDPRMLTLENDGNLLANVTINSAVAATFIGTPASGAPAAKYNWTGVHAVEDGCVNTNLTTTETAFNAGEQLLCANFLPDDSTDEMNISISIGIPEGPTGFKNTTVTFTAAQAGI